MNSQVEKITIVISSEDHPVNTAIMEWVSRQPDRQRVDVVRNPDQAVGGDICFLISCTDIVPKTVLERYSHTLVIHGSDLPEGRGWSPHIWNILNGAEEIVVSLLDAAEKVDSGDIWKKYSYKIPKDFLYEDIIKVVNQAHIDLMDFAVSNCYTVQPKKQCKETVPTYFRKRIPSDSKISPFKSIAEQFDHLRVCDKNRFPSYFHLHGKKYKILIERDDE
jgi:methionyl-tRNA formyltransferase